MIEKAFASALKGIHEGFSRIAERAGRIAKFGQTGDVDSLTDDLVGTKLDIHSVEANAKVIQQVEKTEKSILDILA